MILSQEFKPTTMKDMGTEMVSDRQSISVTTRQCHRRRSCKILINITHLYGIIMLLYPSRARYNIIVSLSVFPHHVYHRVQSSTGRPTLLFSSESPSSVGACVFARARPIFKVRKRRRWRIRISHSRTRFGPENACPTRSARNMKLLLSRTDVVCIFHSRSREQRALRERYIIKPPVYNNNNNSEARSFGHNIVIISHKIVSHPVFLLLSSSSRG